MLTKREMTARIKAAWGDDASWCECNYRQRRQAGDDTWIWACRARSAVDDRVCMNIYGLPQAEAREALVRAAEANRAAACEKFEGRT